MKTFKLIIIIIFFLPMGLAISSSSTEVSCDTFFDISERETVTFDGNSLTLHFVGAGVVTLTVNDVWSFLVYGKSTFIDYVHLKITKFYSPPRILGIDTIQMRIFCPSTLGEYCLVNEHCEESLVCVSNTCTFDIISTGSI